MQRHLLALPSQPAARPNVDNALISESMAWESRWHLTLNNAPLLDTDLVSAGRQLKQYLIPGPSLADAAFVQRLEQVGSPFCPMHAVGPLLGQLSCQRSGGGAKVSKEP